MNKAVFLDRDGVLNEEVGYVKHIDEIKLISEVPNALKKINELGYKKIVITNQAVVSRGWISEKDIDEIHEKMNLKIIENGGEAIDKYYFCPHHPHSIIPKYGIICDCRKPSTGLIIRAALENDIDLKKSWMIGDRITDIVAGKNAGCKTILIKTLNSDKSNVSGKEYDKNIEPDFSVKNMFEAVEIIENH